MPLNAHTVITKTWSEGQMRQVDMPQVEESNRNESAQYIMIDSHTYPSPIKID